MRNKKGGCRGGGARGERGKGEDSGNVKAQCPFRVNVQHACSRSRRGRKERVRLCVCVCVCASVWSVWRRRGVKRFRDGVTGGRRERGEGDREARGAEEGVVGRC